MRHLAERSKTGTGLACILARINLKTQPTRSLRDLRPGEAEGSAPEERLLQAWDGAIHPLPENQ